MLKRLLIPGGAVLVIAVILVAGYYQERNTTSEGYNIECVQPGEPASAPATLSCVIHPGQNAEQSKSSPIWWHKFLAWPEGITAWLLLLTLAGIVWQAQATVDAVKASRDSLKVQEAEFVQWLDIGDCIIEYDKGAYHIGRSGANVFNPPEEMKIRITFPLINNTTRPLSVNGVKSALTLGTENIIKTFITDEKALLPPKDIYKVVIDTTITGSQIIQFIAGGMALIVEGSICVQFVNALNKPDETTFRRMVYSNAFDGTETLTKGHVAKQTEG